MEKWPSPDDRMKAKPGTDRKMGDRRIRRKHA
jgi:hypothetical protein